MTPTGILYIVVFLVLLLESLQQIFGNLAQHIQLDCRG